jgi:hypothetical protein
LKQLAKKKMAETWRTKTRQGEWFTKHPTQVLKQAKLVWKWSVECGIGRAWLFYIFGICQWLPTNYRINYHNPEEPKSVYSASLVLRKRWITSFVVRRWSRRISFANKQLNPDSTFGEFHTVT